MCLSRDSNTDEDLLMILTVGDKIVHAVHGPGIVQDICERQVNGVPSRFYLIRIVATRIDVYLRVSETTQVRPVIERSELHKLEQILGSRPKPLPLENSVRYSVIEQRLGQHDAFHLAELIRDLSGFMKKRLAVSARDLDFFRRTQNMLCVEWALADDISCKAAQERLHRALQVGGTISH